MMKDYLTKGNSKLKIGASLMIILASIAAMALTGFNFAYDLGAKQRLSIISTGESSLEAWEGIVEDIEKENTLEKITTGYTSDGKRYAYAYFPRGTELTELQNKYDDNENMAFRIEGIGRENIMGPVVFIFAAASTILFFAAAVYVIFRNNFNREGLIKFISGFSLLIIAVFIIILAVVSLGGEFGWGASAFTYHALILSLLVSAMYCLSTTIKLKGFIENDRKIADTTELYADFLDDSWTRLVKPVVVVLPLFALICLFYDFTVEMALIYLSILLTFVGAISIVPAFNQLGYKISKPKGRKKSKQAK